MHSIQFPRATLAALLMSAGLGTAWAGPVVSTPFDLEISSTPFVTGSAFAGVSVNTTASAITPLDINGRSWTDPLYVEDASVWTGVRYNYPAPASPQIATDPTHCSSSRPGLCSYIWFDPNHTSDGRNGVARAYFRTTFNLPEFTGDAAPLGAVLRVRADDDFAVWINGFLVMLNADFGTSGDLGPDHVFERGVSQYLRPGEINEMSFVATDGSLNNPSNFGYEHLAFELKLNNQVPEPASLMLGLMGLGGIGLARRRRNG